MKSDAPIILAGGSGFLGMNLARSLTQQGHQVIVLSRSEPDRGAWGWKQWDGKSLDDWASTIDGAQAIVNFAGKSIDCVPTPKNKELIISSRVDSTRVLGEAVASASNPPSVWVQMSAVGIYGNTTNPAPESAPAGEGFLPEVCTQWETAFEKSCPESIRSVVLRAGVVLGRTEGAFPTLRKLAKFGFGGTAGKGTQGMSWIHELDMDALIQRAISDNSMQGVYNATAPHPATNKVFMQTLRRAVRMPIGPPAPAFAVRLGSKLLLKTNPDLALEGQFAVPQRIMDQHHEFTFPNLEDALADLCK
jgi:uncharacterized protein